MNKNNVGDLVYWNLQDTLGWIESKYRTGDFEYYRVTWGGSGLSINYTDEEIKILKANLKRQLKE